MFFNDLVTLWEFLVASQLIIHFGMQNDLLSRKVARYWHISKVSAAAECRDEKFSEDEFDEEDDSWHD